MSTISSSSDPPAVSATTSSISGAPPSSISGAPPSSISGAPPSPLDIMHTSSSPPSTPTTEQAHFTQSTPSRDLTIPNLHVEHDLLGLGDYEVTIQDDDTAPSSSDDSHPVITSSTDVEEEDAIFANAKGIRPIIYSYLMKLGRNGKWQRRFFECDGVSLTYFKTEKRQKQMATLNLVKVGSIAISTEDVTGRTFHIQVADRPYSLRAESESICVDWVIMLNRVKEACLQHGRIKIVTPRTGPQDDKDKPRVVLEANRPRLKPVENIEQLQEIIDVVKSNTNNSSVPSPARQPSNIAFEALTPAARQDMSNWEKESGLQRLKVKVLQWARSIKRAAMECRSPLDVVIEHKNDDVSKSKKQIEASQPKSKGDNIKPNLIPPVDEYAETRELS